MTSWVLGRTVTHGLSRFPGTFESPEEPATCLLLPTAGKALPGTLIL